jgi:hypothetical protein
MTNKGPLSSLIRESELENALRDMFELIGRGFLVKRDDDLTGWKYVAEESKLARAKRVLDRAEVRKISV